MAASLDLLMPKLGLTMTEGTVAQWSVTEGATFDRGEVLATIETDKIASDMEAPAAGTMGPILVTAGAVVKVGTPLARWVPLVRTDAPPPAATAAQSSIEIKALEGKAVEPRSADRSRIVATPYARKRAREAGVNLATISGTGPNGRIKASDIQQASPSQLAVVEPSPHIRAPRLASRQSIATIDVSARQLFEIGNRAGNAEIELVDWIMFALGCCGVRWIGLACAADGEPTGAVEFPQRRSIRAIASLRRAARNEVPPAEELSILIIAAGDDIRSFVPNPPPGWRHAIGVSATRREQLLNLGLSYDDAFLDHVNAHRLLVEMRDLLEEPLSLLAG